MLQTQWITHRSLTGKAFIQPHLTLLSAGAYNKRIWVHFMFPGHSHSSKYTTTTTTPLSSEYDDPLQDLNHSQANRSPVLSKPGIT